MTPSPAKRMRWPGPLPAVAGAARRVDQVAVGEELISLVAEDEAEHGFGMVADAPEGDVVVAGQGEGVPRFTLRLPAMPAAVAIAAGLDRAEPSR